MDNKIKKRISPTAIGETPGDDTMTDPMNILPQPLSIEEGKLFPPVGDEGGKKENPHSDIMGVEKLIGLNIGIDYLEFTIYQDDFTIFRLYSETFMDRIGDLTLQGQAKLYEKRYIGADGFQLLTAPKNRRCHYHNRMILPGKACQHLGLEDLRKFVMIARESNIRINCTRIDLKADNCPFTPFQIFDAIEQGKAETRATRETLKKFHQPFEKREDGKIGTTGITLGSRTSERFLRIYDLHGFTRFELESKGTAAEIYWVQLMENIGNFSELAMGIFQDFIRIDADFWREFTENYKRAYMNLTDYADPTLEKLEKWIDQQAAPAIGILMAIKGKDRIEEIAENGLERARENSRYYPLLHAYGLLDE